MVYPASSQLDGCLIGWLAGRPSVWFGLLIQINRVSGKKLPVAGNFSSQVVMVLTAVHDQVGIYLPLAPVTGTTNQTTRRPFPQVLAVLFFSLSYFIATPLQRIFNRKKKKLYDFFVKANKTGVFYL